MYVAAALAIILVVALVIKPMMTKSSSTNSSLLTPTSIPSEISSSASGNSTISVTAVTTQATPKPIPTHSLSVQTVGFVDPSTYHISIDEPVPNGTHINQIPLNNSRTTIATISGKFSGTTQIIEIPYPYWELVYTVQPSTGSVPGKVQVTPTMGEGASSSGISGSYSTALPEFTLLVMDGNDPNRIVRTISPPGGIDLNLWLGKKKVVTNPQDNAKSNQSDNPGRYSL